jgi:DNA-binding transcriptional LysR family regulator
MKRKTAARRSGNLLRNRLRMSQIELLAAMERSPTLSAAARDVNLTQPAASRLLNTLTADLGIALFERVGRTLKPTAAGQALIRKAAEFVADLDRTQSDLEAIDEGLIGTISVGAGVSSCYVLVPRAVTLLLKTTPRIAVSVREGGMDELAARLREGRIDLLVGRFESDTPYQDIAIERLYSPSVRVVCGPQHPLARKRNPMWKELIQEAWILPESGTPMRSAVESLFRRQGIRPQASLVESSAIQANVALLNSLNLIWVLSEDVSEYFAGLGALHIVNVPELDAPGPFIIGHLRHRRLSPSAERMRDCLFEAARPKASRRR